MRLINSTIFQNMCNKIPLQYCLIVLILLFSVLAKAQGSHLLDNQSTLHYQDSVKIELEACIENLHILKDLLERANLMIIEPTIESPITTTVNANSYLRKTPKAFGERLVSLNAGDTVEIIGIEDKYFKF